MVNSPCYSSVLISVHVRSIYNGRQITERNQVNSVFVQTCTFPYYSSFFLPISYPLMNLYSRRLNFHFQFPLFTFWKFIMLNIPSQRSLDLNGFRKCFLFQIYAFTNNDTKGINNDSPLSPHMTRTRNPSSVDEVSYHVSCILRFHFIFCFQRFMQEATKVTFL